MCSTVHNNHHNCDDSEDRTCWISAVLGLIIWVENTKLNCFLNTQLRAAVGILTVAAGGTLIASSLDFATDPHAEAVRIFHIALCHPTLGT